MIRSAGRVSRRRRFVKLFFQGIVGGGAAMAFPGMFQRARNAGIDGNGSAPKRVQPNIILVVVDDQRLQALEIMPTVRSQLAARGITFPNSFCASPVCAPSRASILTGQYVHNHGEDTNAARQFVNKRDKRDTIATMVRAGGYKTVFLGKYSHGYNMARDVPPGWDEWQAFLGGAPGYYDYRMSDNGRAVAYGDRPADYSTDVLAQKACRFIRDHRNSSQPFFMYVAPCAPHAPGTPAPRHLHRLDHLDFPVPAVEEDIRDKPQWVHDYRRLNSGNRKAAAPGRKVGAIRRGWAALLAVDEMIAGIRAALEETGKIQDTYIFYLADNGDDFSPHVNASGKLLPYEEGIRTPIIVRGPGVEAGGRRDHLVSTVDLLPTIASLAGVPVPGFADGRDLAPLFSCRPLPLSKWRKACLVELGKVTRWYRQSPPPPYKLLRTMDSKYIEYGTGEREFYDLRRDPGELVNTYEKLAAGQQNGLHSWLQRLQAAAGEKCREAEEDGL